MAELKTNKKTKLMFNKTDICILLGCDYREFKHFLPDSIKDELKIDKGHRYFTDLEALKVIKAFRPALSDEIILKKLYPNGF